MAVLFWYLARSDFSRVRWIILNVTRYTGHFTLYMVPEQHGHVYLVTLYIDKVREEREEEEEKDRDNEYIKMVSRRAILTRSRYKHGLSDNLSDGLSD